jgi:hypothetical protein
VWRARAAALAAAGVLTVAVAEASLMGWRSYDRRQRAAAHAQQEQACLWSATWAEDAAGFYGGRNPDAPRWLEQAGALRKKAGWHARMKRRYERAAARPWAAVPSDPVTQPP